MKGKLIALEGIDSSGKNRQSELLVKHLRRNGFKCRLFHFPRYETVFGKIIRRYLKGAFGNKDSLAPEFSSLLYSIDRYHASDEIEKLLGKGYIVIANRYTPSNVAHQAALIKNQSKRKKFMKWTQAVEAALPSPDLIILLDMPLPAAKVLMKRRGRKRDIYERDNAYLERARGIFLQLSRGKKWRTIKCASRRGGQRSIMPIQGVHELVWNAVQEIL